MKTLNNNCRQAYEVADVLRNYYQPKQMDNRLTTDQKKAFDDILKCRTATCGGHINVCNNCGYQQPQYNSCRNRNCPKCQFLKQQRWVDKLEAKLLPCRYFHLVFTIPAELRSLFMYNPKICYGLLFKASSETIKKVTFSRHRVKVGNIGVLHTWTQTLEYHPHIHYMLTAGGLTEDEMEWRAIDHRYLAPQKMLSGIFRALLCRYIREAFALGKLKSPACQYNYDSIEQTLFRKEWKVFVEKPFKGPRSLVRYLGKYVHRVALSNNRIKNIDNKNVTLSCRDNKNKHQKRLVHIPADVFIMRFAKHIVPSGFYKIRHFGVFASILSKTIYEQCIALIDKDMDYSKSQGLCGVELCRKNITIELWKCPRCSKGILRPESQAGFG